MKLLICTICLDTLTICDHWYTCSCGRSSARKSRSGKGAAVRGPGRVLELNSRILTKALATDEESIVPAKLLPASILTR